MTRPLTIPEILARRPITNGGGGAPVSGMPSSSTNSVFTLTTTPQKRVLSIVCWNVQVFTAGKAEANPYVNVIIGATLEALGADLCVLLETRDHVSVNLAAVEHRIANPVSNATLHIPSEEEWDEHELIAEDVQRMRAMETLAAAPTTYRMIGSALTGKRYKPPKRLYLYGNGQKFFPKFLKQFANGAWKEVFEEYQALSAYYDVYSQTLGLQVDYRGVLPTGETDVEFRLKRCGDCNAHLGDGTCDTCAWSAQEEPYLTALRETLDEVAWSLAGSVQLETYGVLVRPNAIGVDGGDGLIHFDDKSAAVDARGCRLASYGVAPRPDDAILRDAQARLNCPVTGVFDTATQLAVGGYQSANGLTVTGTLDAPTLAALGVATRMNVPLGYLDPTSAYYGRSPFIIPILFSAGGTEVRLPVVAFHAPYGKSDENGLNARGDAVLAIEDADVGGFTPTSAVADAIIIGDLNLDTSASPSTQDGRAAVRAYTALQSKGYSPKTVGVKSSLIGLSNPNWKKQKKKDKYDGARWTSITGSTSDFVSSAYDNVLVKGGVNAKVLTGAIIDVIDFIQQNLTSFDLTEALREYPDLKSLSPEQIAFFIYHAYVSDHLPVLIDIEVDPAPDNFRQTMTALAQQRRIEMLQQMRRHFEVTGTIRHIAQCPAPAATIAWGTDEIWIGTLKQTDPYNEQYAVVTLDCGGAEEQFAVEHGYAEKIFPEEGVVIVSNQDRVASIAIRAIPGAQHFRGLPNKGGIVVGQVTRHSQDGERFRLVGPTVRATIPRIPDVGLPEIGSTLLVVYSGVELTEISTRPS